MILSGEIPGTRKHAKSRNVLDGLKGAEVCLPWATNRLVVMRVTLKQASKGIVDTAG